jgi:nucleotide-binding universal stress UspA family protein
MKTRAREPAAKRTLFRAPPGKLRQILVPTDFSPAARRASRYAATLAQQRRASLTLLHVVPSETYQVDYGYGPVVRHWASRACVSGATQRLRSFGHSHCGGARAAEVVVRCGDKVGEIVRVAREVKSDLIVLGETPVTLNSAKSTAQEIAENAPCPVLLVRAATVELINHRGDV